MLVVSVLPSNKWILSHRLGPGNAFHHLKTNSERKPGCSRPSANKDDAISLAVPNIGRVSPCDLLDLGYTSAATQLIQSMVRDAGAEQTCDWNLA
jgi:hypothetical protein